MNIYLFQRILAIGILSLQILIALFLIYIIYRKISGKSFKMIESFLQEQGMLLVGLIALGGIIGSLIFSDVYHIEPCKLCWLQRIVLYPQALIMLIAAKKRDLQAWAYTLWFSVVGLVISLYQVNEQLGISDLIPEAECVSGADAACSQIHMLEFGYITFPLASATLFAFILILYFMRKAK